MAEQEKRTIKTALDLIPFGSGGPDPAVLREQKSELPSGVTRSMLRSDVLMITLPSLCELVLTQLTSMADQVMVGRLPGEEGIMALSAVGIAMQPKFLLMTMGMAMNVGATAMIARYRGKQDRRMANQAFRQALFLNLLLGLAFSALGLVGAEGLIRFMGGENLASETMQAGIRYVQIAMYGFLPLMMTFTITGALRGIGDSRTPLIYNTIANVVNLIFNYMMIYGKFGFPRMGVDGAAWATNIGQIAAFLIAVATVFGKDRYLRVDLREPFRFDWELMKDIALIGIPSMIEQLFMRTGIIIYTRFIVGLGDLYYATHQILMSVQAMTFMTGQGFATASTTLMGQSLGKRRYDMAKLYMQTTRQLGFWVSILLALLMVFFNRTIIGFYNSTPEITAVGSQIMILMAASQPIQNSQFIITGGLRGAGDTRYTAVVMAVTVLGVRTVLAWFAIRVLDLGIWGAWIALIADQCLRSLLVLLRFRSGRWAFILPPTQGGGQESQED